MKYRPIDPQLFVEHRENLKRLLAPNALAVVNSNDILPTNADGSMLLRANSDLFYLTGIEQEESLLLLYPDAHDEKFREILFLREPNALAETWEGHKWTQDEAKQISGVARVAWLSEFRGIFHRLMCEAERVYLNSNEHKRADSQVETREARFVRETMRAYPLHEYRRLAPLLHGLRAVKAPAEIEVLQHACDITSAGFRRVARFVRPGVNEMEVEAEYAHEFIRRGARFAYDPIVASGANACVLHYVQNDQPCRDGDLLLLDVAASYANYNADLTRTLPVNGRFSRRQRQIYNAVERVLHAASAAATPGKLPRDWQKEAETFMEKELVDLGLLKMAAIRNQHPDHPAVKKYFMHGIGHPLGLDVHDVAQMDKPMASGWVVTVEPGIYIPAEKMAVRLENNIVLREGGNLDLMADVPLAAADIEDLMRAKRRKRKS
ncbi:MAG TPA: aminopeptidase P N-terminal domain-containing protein [Verrucomicrobiae bacterium]|jgi:Xaa-Pro aminopeptidase|nr:aminopeptidase P N-terminal domain-containing protein [Verrucomicrobiae bacterium]